MIMTIIELEILESLLLKSEGNQYSLDFLMKKYNLSYSELITIIYSLINKKMVYKSFLQNSNGVISSLLFPGFEITNFGKTILNENKSN